MTRSALATRAPVALAAFAIAACNSPAPPPPQPPAITIAPLDAAPPAAPTAEQDAAPATAAFCVPPDAQGVDHVALSGNALSFCVGREQPGEPTCASLDLAAGTYAALPAPSPAPAAERRTHDGQRTIETSNTQAKVCRAPGDECRTVAIAGFRPTTMADRFGGARIPADVSADGTTLFLVRHEGGKSEKVFGETYDLASGRRVSRFPIEADEYVVDVAWVGPRVFVETCVEEGPGCMGKLVDPKTGKAEEGLGLNFCCTTYDAFFHVAGDTWAFVDGSGTSIVWKNAKTLAVEKKADLRPQASMPGSTGFFRRPGENDLFVVYDVGDAGEVWQVDLGTGAVAKKWKPQACATDAGP